MMISLLMLIAVLLIAAGAYWLLRFMVRRALRKQLEGAFFISRNKITCC